MVETTSARGSRRIQAADFCTGVKQNALRPGQLIAAVLLRHAGPQQFCKVGTRNAMVIAVASFAVRNRPGPAAGRHRDRVGGAHPAARARRPRSWPACSPGAGCGSARRNWPIRN